MEELRIMGRATQGVRLIKLNDNDKIAAVAKIEIIDGVIWLVERKGAIWILS